MCPFSSLAFLQPTTVDKEPNYFIKNNSTIISIYMTRVNKNPARQKNLMNLG